MDSTEYPKSAALIALLNEIEMLLGELRAMESLIQGAQALTAERIAHLRAEHQREIAALRSALFERAQSQDSEEIARETDSATRHASSPVNEKLVSGRAAETDVAMERSEALNESTLNAEHVAMQNDEHERDTIAPTGHHKAASPDEAEQNLRDEIIRLRQEARDTGQILQNRNDELVRVKLQLDQLQERMAQLESSLPDESSADAPAERIRTEFQAQVALLQAEISQKEWAFEERQAEARSRELQLRQQITALRKQLISTHRERERRDAVLGVGADDPAENDLAVDGGEGESAHGTFAAQRRWKSGLGRKRRWRV
jgi:hypothetical protein